MVDLLPHGIPNDLYDALKLFTKTDDVMQWWWNHQIPFLLRTIFIFFIISGSYLVLFWIKMTVISLYLRVYRYVRTIRKDFTSESWDGARKLIAHIYRAQGELWFGYEIKGSENIPLEGPSLIVFYHGALPMDFLYVMSDTYLRKHRLINLIADRSIFKLPAMQAFIECFQLHEGNIDYCVEKLQQGNLLAISPGGAREMLMGDNNYSLMWGKRTGFAKVAIKAQVPIIPVFTSNIREAFFTMRLERFLFRPLYEKLRVPFLNIYGGFPVKLTIRVGENLGTRLLLEKLRTGGLIKGTAVLETLRNSFLYILDQCEKVCKLRTFIGKPIPYDPALSAEELVEKVAQSMGDLIRTHQQIPGSIVLGLKERIEHLLKRS